MYEGLRIALRWNINLHEYNKLQLSLNSSQEMQGEHIDAVIHIVPRTSVDCISCAVSYWKLHVGDHFSIKYQNRGDKFYKKYYR